MADKKNALFKNVPYREKIYNSLRERIMNGDLRPGEHLVEIDLANDYNISRSPVREALRLLEADGLVVSQEPHGMYVRKFSDSDIREIYQIREALGDLALQSALVNQREEDLCALKEILDASEVAFAETDYDRYIQLNQEFHARLVQMGGMPRVSTILANINAGIRYLSAMNLKNSTRVKESIEEHMEIYDALSAKDEERLIASFNRHIRMGLNGSMEVYRKINQIER